MGRIQLLRAIPLRPAKWFCSGRSVPHIVEAAPIQCGSASSQLLCEPPGEPSAEDRSTFSGAGPCPHVRLDFLAAIGNAPLRAHAQELLALASLDRLHLGHQGLKILSPPQRIKDGLVFDRDMEVMAEGPELMLALQYR